MRCTPCKWVVVLVLSLTSLAVPAITVAQTPTFNVEGVISDEQQAVLPGASVTIRNVAQKTRDTMPRAAVASFIQQTGKT